MVNGLVETRLLTIKLCYLTTFLSHIYFSRCEVKFLKFAIDMKRLILIIFDQSVCYIVH